MKDPSRLERFYSQHIVIITGACGLLGFMLWIAHFLKEDFTSAGSSLAIEWNNYHPKVDFGSVGKDSKLFFNQFPKFELWILFNAAQVAIWFALTPLALFRMIQVCREYDLKFTRLWINYAITIATVCLLFLIIRHTTYNYFLNFGFDDELNKFDALHDSLFKNQAAKIMVGNVVGFLAQTFIIACLVSLINAARAFRTDLSTDEITKPLSQDILLQKFIKLRETFFAFIVFVSLEIIFTFVATSILSSAINDLAQYTIYPFEHVLTLGFLMTIILSAFFFPAYFKLSSVGHDLIDKYLNSLSLDDYADRIKKTKELNDHLHLNLTLRENFQVFLAALSPLVGTILPKVIELVT